MLSLQVRLRFGSYDAAADADPRRPEWPPHPARVFCALVASDPSEEEWSALDWLERQSPPLVISSGLLAEKSDPVFVPTNDVGGSSPNLPGRSNGLRTKPRALPERNIFYLVWEGVDAAPGLVRLLDALASRVPYVGRATSSVELTFTADAPSTDGWDVYEPASERADRDLRAPYAGYGRRLRDAHERGERAWESGRAVGYRLRSPPSHDDGPPPAEGPFGRVLAFRFARPAYVHSSLTAAVTDRLRKAVISLVPDPVPSVVSGHGADARTHVAYLALPNVGVPGQLPGGASVEEQNPHADGRILGLALAVPRGDDELARMLYEALVAEDDAGGLRYLPIEDDRLPLLPATVGAGPMGAQVRRWTRPSALWATATPLVLDRYPKGEDVDALVANAVMTAGYPPPVEVVSSPKPVLPGSPVLARSAVRRRAGVPTRPWTHAWVRFEQDVVGPVAAGSMRYRGLGLFAPVDRSTARQGKDIGSSAPVEATT